ncbi:carbohydrate ABC transporter permease [Acidipropionibacterium acidipropionici]|jgi:multiple sugar transport system permease protein|uniref:carbohydrate ABC transporter permease n=1 Tax=Acidipropionibacterium acidipropionici TaxID=1748 RepID=UPI00110BB6B2|nr:carbohydrate ABC transporter permease [Acidipropionibacterium acidipropionici]QCV95260.1 carbohydrate ABC transporter permease [Acidipropionibacterium acidipropionici]
MSEQNSSARMVRGRGGRAAHTVKLVLLFVLAAIFLLPFYVIFRNAFTSDQGFVSPQWKWLPDNLSGSVLSSLFTDSDLGLLSAMGHSAIQSVGQTLLTVVVSFMAGYGLARFRNRAAGVVLKLTVLTLMVPTAVTFVPSFIMTSQFGWIDSYRGLIVPVMFSAFATYLFRQSLLGFPRELEEAAELDGANPWTVMWRVVLPNSMGIVAAVSTITFIGAWNAFLWPLLVARDNTRTVQLTLSRFMTSQGVDYAQLFAGALVAIVPVVLVFLFLQRYLVQGMTTSGLD